MCGPIIVNATHLVAETDWWPIRRPWWQRWLDWLYPPWRRPRWRWARAGYPVGDVLYVHPNNVQQVLAETTEEKEK